MLNETFWEFSNTVYCCTSEHKVLPINIAACFVAFGFRNDYNSVRIAFQNLDLHHVRLAFFMQHHSTFEVPEENPFITFGSDKITAIRIYSHVSDVAQKKSRLQAEARQCSFATKCANFICSSYPKSHCNKPPYFVQKVNCKKYLQKCDFSNPI